MMVAIGMVGCSRHPAESSAGEKPYRIQAVYKLSYVTWGDSLYHLYVNDEPLGSVGGDSSGWVDITAFVVDGTNRLRVVAVRHAGVEHAPAHIRVLSCPPAPSVGILFEIDLASPDLGHKELERQFTASVGHRWLWQDAQALTGLTTADKEQMHSLLTQYGDALRDHDLARVEALFERWVLGSRPITVSAEDDALLRQSSEAMEQLVTGAANVRVAPADDILFIAGKHLVRAQCRRQPVSDRIGGPFLIEAEHEGSPVSVAPFEESRITESFRYFVKVDGTWRMLAFNWAY
jgi:hypothetical protein